MSAIPAPSGEYRNSPKGAFTNTTKFLREYGKENSPASDVAPPIARRTELMEEALTGSG
jgi:hypothetical protein